MPPRPHSPLRTHSAPSLPEPLQSDIFFAPPNAHAGRTRTDKARCFLPGLRGVHERWTDAATPDPIAPLHPKQTNAPQSLKPHYSRGHIVPSECSAGKTNGVRKRVISASVMAVVNSAKEQRAVLTEAAPATNTMPTAVKGSQLPLRKEGAMRGEDVAPLPSAPTAYEAALAEYGAKLLSMMHRRKSAEHRQSRERLSRRKAVNEKYSELSRPPAAAGSGRRVSSNHQVGGNAVRGRESGARGLMPGAGAGAKARNAEADVAAARILPDKNQGVKPAAIDDHPPCSCKTEVGVGTPHDRGGSQNGEVRGASPAGESVSVELEIEVEKKGTTAKRRGCGNQDASAHRRRGREGWAQTDSLFCAQPLVTSLPAGRQASREGGAVGLADTLDRISLVAPLPLTPPRPLRRARSLGPRPSCMGEETRKSKGVFSRIFSTTKAPFASMTDNPHDIEGWGFTLHTPQKETCDTERKALVFIRPHPKPRPLHRCHESKALNDDKTWKTRGIPFRGCAWDDKACIDKLRFSSFESCDQTWKRDGEIRRGTFTNVVPQYVLDEFARRGRLRTAWRRWRRRLWAARAQHSPARFSDPLPTAGEGDGSRWAGLKAWLAASTLPSALP
ncbi:uncharacterized protein Tco025E_03093 [Trypanosoma conorhini]|uniref:Uncharacterized protein n=1 Tax=Trypanosoma conorhini TaxID=83891 RepID=A0A3R7MYR4_9TRYP|nr:uncharacterized protein Tco025E_03093 [Trypanosoma conorhini]RNF22700.1 hypothetical protein Tco025E_03093 [Trypanosoma conorhini]